MNTIIKKINIPAGAQFNSPLSLLLFFVVLFLLFFSVKSAAQFHIFDFIFSFLGLFISFVFMMDYRGVEIDISKRRIRSYRQFLFLKWGSWFLLEEYTELRLKAAYGRVRGAKVNSCKSYSQTYYDVVLISKNNTKNIILKEFNRYDKSLQFIEFYANVLHLPYVDDVKQGAHY